MAKTKKTETIQSKGGKARAAAMTPEQRSEVARAAADARWAARAEEGWSVRRIPRATHDGVLQLGDFELPCAVLEDGRRVLTQSGFNTALGRAGNPYRRPDQDFEVPPFLAANNLKPFISEDLRRSFSPIKFRSPGYGGLSGVSLGYAAELLPRVCRVYLEARDAGVLARGQEHIARACDLLVRGLATVGIVAMVDEATGYQDERDRQELQKILAAYISEELLPWAERFPRDFYKEMFRLRGWSFNPISVKGPRYAGKLTNALVYEKLPPGVLEELRRKNPPDANGQRRHRHHQYLTDDIGNPTLEKHVAVVTAVMRLSPDWETFKTNFQRAFPTKGEQMRLDLPVPADGDE